ncbi:MAG: hypothetical protein HQM10_05305 [Candidatus Riflebacteria bacterium]|nr:hypothetical protein [Candidatus Riflebacteria bacterium]
MRIYFHNISLMLGIIMVSTVLFITGCGGSASGTGAVNYSEIQAYLIPVQVYESGAETLDGIYAFAGGPAVTGGWIEDNPGSMIQGSGLEEQIMLGGYERIIFSDQYSLSSKKYYLKYVTGGETRELENNINWAVIPKFPNRPILQWNAESRVLSITSEPVNMASTYQFEIRSESGRVLQQISVSNPNTYLTVQIPGTYHIVFSAIKKENEIPVSKSIYIFTKNLGESDFTD